MDMGAVQKEEISVTVSYGSHSNVRRVRLLMIAFFHKYEDDPLVNMYDANKCCFLSAEQFKTKTKTHWQKPSGPGNFPG